MDDGLRSAARFVTIDEMNQEALQLFETKKQELRDYNATIAEAERIMKLMQEKLDQRQKELNELSKAPSNIDKMQDNADVEAMKIKEEAESEMRKLQIKHEEEIDTLKADYERMIKTTTLWAENHAQVALAQKQRELEKAKRQESELQQKVNELSFMAPTRRKRDDGRRAAAQRIAKLEQQLSEISSVVREEMRESRSKIDECLAVVETRQRKNAEEIKRLETEIQQRQENNDKLLAALRQQCEEERKTVEMAIAATNQKSETAQARIAQMEKQYDQRLQEMLTDIQSVRQSTVSAAEQDGSEIKGIVRQIKQLEEEKRMILEETKVVKNEIEELNEENRLLKRELANLNVAYDRIK